MVKKKVNSVPYVMVLINGVRVTFKVAAPIETLTFVPFSHNESVPLNCGTVLNLRDYIEPINDESNE